MMMKICAATGFAALSLALLMGSASAQDITPKAQDAKPEAEDLPTYKPITLTIDNYVTFDNLGTAISTHEIDIVFEGQFGDWLLGADAWGGFSHDFDLKENDIEVPGLELYAINDAFGELHLWDASAALSNACIQPTGGSSHFGTEDLLNFGTCGGYSGQTILYVTPTFNGFSGQVSASNDIEGLSELGDVDSSVSAALTYANTTDGGLDISASFGVDAAMSVNGGVPAGTDLPVTVQAGVNIGWEGWILGAAAQYEFASLSGGEAWGAGVGLTKSITDEFTVTVELAADGYEDSGATYKEVSIGATAEYMIFENTYIDAAVNVVRLTGDDGTDQTATVFGMGLSVAF